MQPEDRPVTELELDPRSALVVVTDGLVERRGEDIDEGVDRVLAIAAAADQTSARSLLTQIVSGASQSRLHDDDVTVLVLRRT